MAAREYSAEAIASAAMSLSLLIIEKVVEKGLLPKEEIVDAVMQIADAKISKATLYKSGAEAEAAELLTQTAERLDSRLK